MLDNRDLKNRDLPNLIYNRAVVMKEIQKLSPKMAKLQRDMAVINTKIKAIDPDYNLTKKY